MLLFNVVVCRYFPKDIVMTMNGVGRLPPTFGDARSIAENILDSGYDFQQGYIIYNEFRFVTYIYC